MVRHRWLLKGVLVLCVPLSLLGQKNHTTEWKSGSKPSVFDQLDAQTTNGNGSSQSELSAQRQQRLADLRRELDAVIRSASALQQQLQSTDPNTTLSLDLRNQGKQLEEVARKIRKGLNEL